MSAAVFAPWQRRIYDQAKASIDAGRLGHGLLFCGPAQLGKRAVAERLAHGLLCRDRDAAGEPCGRCRSCLLLAAGTHPDYQLVSFVPNKEGTKLRTENCEPSGVRASAQKYCVTVVSMPSPATFQLIPGLSDDALPITGLSLVW